MTRIIQVTKVQETSLWKALSEKEGEDALSLSANVLSLCDEAIDRMKAMYAYAPQYTLHDDRHMLRTTELMGLVLGSEVEQLNVIELTLLILAAFFHDQGMVLTEDEFLSLEEDEDFRVFRDNWLIDHPNYGETVAQMELASCSEARKARLARQVAELDAAMLTDYIRKTHAGRSAEFIRSRYGGDKRIEVQNVNLAPFLATLCESHTFPSEALVPVPGFRYDEQIGTYTVNLPFLAAVVRLADILDFDRDRTPEVLLKSIHFTSPVSLHEWEKHRSVQGWHISEDLIRFTIRCPHPAYEAAARQYMDWIDKELAASRRVCRMQPRELNDYELNLPTQVDRSRIEPLDNTYRFHNLEFSLSRDEVVRLLMTDKLYGKEHLCIRELLQNSLDALRYRKALFSDSGTEWNEGRVELRHYVNRDGYEVLECHDNGCGMDEDIIRNYFVRVGRSFYRSPSFEREMNRLKASGSDFDPCSQFGIGFMSCFMLGDRITVTTRRDYGPGREWGPPLVVEIRGLSGLLVIREGSADQPVGTTISIVSRQKPSFLDSWTDKVQLCRVLKGYALATEFPIVGRCDVPELEETVTIPSSVDTAPTLLEVAQVEQSICCHQELSEVSSFLGGFVRESFLVDDSGLPCLANSQAEWYGKAEGTRRKWDLRLLPTDRELGYEYTEWGVPVCVDGILVAGKPGRPSCGQDVGARLGCRNSGINSPAPALIDARGPLKPELGPGRTPPDRFSIDLPPGWQRLNDIFKQGLGLLWEQLADYVHDGLSYETFWRLAVVHGVSVGWIPCGTLWETLAVMITREGHGSRWRLARNLGEMSMCSGQEESFVLRNEEGWTIGPDSELAAWEREGEERPHLSWRMNSVILLMACLDVRAGKVRISLSPLSDPRIPLEQYAKSSPLGVRLFLVDHAGHATDALAVQTPYPTANREHGLAKVYHQSRHMSKPTDLQMFARSFVSCISESLSTRKQTPSLDEPGYWQKRVAHLYFSVRWDQYDESLRPPYKLWTEDKGWFLFGEDDFAYWRDSSAHVE
jgi:hypothetical protein